MLLSEKIETVLYDLKLVLNDDLDNQDEKERVIQNKLIQIWNKLRDVKMEAEKQSTRIDMLNEAIFGMTSIDIGIQLLKIKEGRD